METQIMTHNHGGHKHEAHPPFVDFHCTVADGHAHVEGILPISDFEATLTGLAIDASGSMRDEFGASQSVLTRWLGGNDSNVVDPAVQAVIAYLGGQVDSDSDVYVAYFAAGNGRQVYIVDPEDGELTPTEAAARTFNGPPGGDFGSETHLLPAVRDFVEHIHARIAAGEVVERAILTVVTDGAFHDYDQLVAYSRDLQAAISEGTFPKLVISIVGVGDQVSEEQLERLLHDTTEEDADHAIFCFNVVDEMPDLAAITAHLADADIIAARGGLTVATEDGDVILRYEDAVPALVEFEVPEDIGAVEITLNGVVFNVPIDEHEDHDDEHEDEHERAHAH